MKKIHIFKSIGEKIRERRRRMGLSQERLGELTGVSYQQIQKYEKGINQVGIDRLQRIAAILREPFDFFLKDAQATREDVPLYGGLTSSEKKLLKYFREIDDQKIKSEVIALIRIVVKLGKK